MADDLAAGYESDDECAEVCADRFAQSMNMNDVQEQNYQNSEMPESNIDPRMGGCPDRAGCCGPKGPNIPPPEMRVGYDPRGNRISANTGPKGVKADYAQAKQEMRENRLRGMMRQRRALDSMANGPSDLSNFEGHVNHEDKPPPPKDSDDEESDSWDESCDSEDEAFQRYKLQRIQAVQNTLPIFGSHDRIQTNSMLASVVKQAHELVYVLVHIYENNVPSCTALNLCMESLATQFQHIRFCRIRSSDSMKGYNIKGLPTLMVYRGGKPVKTFIRMQDQIKGEITDLKLAHFLSSQGILQMPGSDLFKGLKRPGAEKEGNSIRTSRVTYNSDDEDY